MKNKKTLMLVLVIFAALFLLSGCSVPTDPETKEVILITSDTTFKSIMDSESWFSAFFVFPLAKIINALTPYAGVASSISLVTIGVHLIVLLLTLKSTIASQKMQTIQPELTKIQKKYEGKTDENSKMRMAKEMEDLYSKHNINPLSTIITSFIQIPVFLSIYHAVQRSEAVKFGSFLGMSLQKTPLSGITSGEWGYLLLFIIMILAQVGSMMFPQFLANHKAKKEAELQHKKYVKAKSPLGNSMYLIMLPVLVFSISWASAMTIYWIISSLVAIGKALLVQFILSKKA